MKQVIIIGILALAIALSIVFITQYPPQTPGTTSSTTPTTPQQVTSPSSITSSTSATPGASGGKLAVKGISFNDLVEGFNHLMVRYEHYNATSEEITTVVFTYDKSIEEFNGTQVYKLVFTQEIIGKNTSTVTMWVSMDLSRIIQIEVGGRVYSGAMAQYGGAQVVRVVNYLLAITGEQSLSIDEATAKVILAKNGWILENYGPTNLEISGKSYSGYTYVARNVNDNSSNVTKIAGAIVKLKNTIYSIVKIRADFSDGDYVTFEVTELE
ncbi:MAG: hypothetical protein ABWW65_05865 [Thermoprotei archaeon]